MQGRAQIDCWRVFKRNVILEVHHNVDENKILSAFPCPRPLPHSITPHLKHSSELCTLMPSHANSTAKVIPLRQLKSE